MPKRDQNLVEVTDTFNITIINNNKITKNNTDERNRRQYWEE